MADQPCFALTIGYIWGNYLTLEVHPVRKFWGSAVMPQLQRLHRLEGGTLVGVEAITYGR